MLGRLRCAATGDKDLIGLLNKAGWAKINESQHDVVAGLAKAADISLNHQPVEDKDNAHRNLGLGPRYR